MEKINTLKPDYKIMRMILNQCLSLNRGRALSVILLKFFLQSLLLVAAMTPIYIGLYSGGISILGIFSSCLLLLVSCAVDFVLEYGQSVSCSRMVEKKNVTVGYLFSGFRDRARKKIFLSSLFLTLISVAVVAVGIFIFWKILDSSGLLDIYLSVSENLDSDAMFRLREASEKIAEISGNMTWLMTILILIVRLPFIYLWLVIYRRGDLGVFRAMKISASLFFRQMFRFIGFVIYVSWKDALSVIVLILLSNFLSSDIVPYGFRFLTLVVSIMQLVEEVRLLVKINLSIPVYFYSMTGILEIHLSEYKKEDSEETEPAEIEDKSDEEKSASEIDSENDGSEKSDAEKIDEDKNSGAEESGDEG